MQILKDWYGDGGEGEATKKQLQQQQQEKRKNLLRKWKMCKMVRKYFFFHEYIMLWRTLTITKEKNKKVFDKRFIHHVNFLVH